ncbi:ubiquinone/menaquinone biosynthesis methyltransferase [Silvibacterium dinghuense]|uniref:Demethylmenaquinone methyltransferase n=1 Tax=Silvibacterium dinghuense TaxID=1560006 RepID=A0A4V1NVE9_9BACT|nr:ubiquinone/menaquinone biosynthesis methyltransferase [Silvibacterium dinghuense]RXS95530.1 ubiquinone/menaquinone biosynthesis methyltransferase [Silvibacterium dinghuense]GGH13799.1 demethylmenaquinone methyltransferase [Silvibacterium dinghuense]
MSPSASGARPAGATDEVSSAAGVQQMFNQIAPRYDLLNHVLSCNVDRWWWWRTARRFDGVLKRSDAAVLDICCGTGDMTLALLKRRPQGSRPVLAADFSHGMLARGAEKFAKFNTGNGGAVAIEADALHLPIASGSLDLITSAFGFRNLANYEAGLREFFRTLAPGGQLGILDFSEPGGPLGKLYAFYFRRILPAIGARLSGMGSAYAYLPSSVANFPPPEEMLALMRKVGFTDVSWTPYTFGIAGLYRAVKR